MTDYDVNETLDVTGEHCPMPVVKTRQHIDQIEDGQILEVIATDPGSMSDLGGLAESTGGVELLDQEELTDTYRHYVRKTES